MPSIEYRYVPERDLLCILAFSLDFGDDCFGATAGVTLAAIPVAFDDIDNTLSTYYAIHNIDEKDDGKQQDRLAGEDR